MLENRGELGVGANIENHEKSLYKEPLAVVGSGLIGLSTAILALEAGYPVTIYSDESEAGVAFRASDSAFAQGLPFAPGENLTPVQKEQYKHWFEETFHRFLSLKDLGGYGVSMRRNIELLASETAEPYEMESVYETLSNFSRYSSAELPEGFHSVWDYTTFMVEMKVYMEALRQTFLAKGGTFVDRKFESLDEMNALTEKALVNCTGLGSKKLMSDGNLKGLQGWRIEMQPLDAPVPIMAADYTIFGTVSEDGAKSNFVIGTLSEPAPYDETTGTFSPVVDHTLQVDKIIENTRALIAEPILGIDLTGIIPDLTRENIVRITSGLRPYRLNGVNDSMHITADINGDQRVLMHNYGHGGSGVSLSWGSAKHVVDMLDRALAYNLKD